MGGACSAYGKRGSIYSVLYEKLRGRDYWEDLRLDRRIIIKLFRM
jgi:hypothetical protein